MDNPSAESVPHQLMTMSSAITPQQAFENADCLLVEALTIRESAKKLEEQAESLRAKAMELDDNAYAIQYQAMEHREEIETVFDSLLARYNHILPLFNAVKPDVIPETTLTVEEGRALVEEVNAVEELLRNFLSETLFATDVKNDADLEVNSAPAGPPAGLPTQNPISEALEDIISTNKDHTPITSVTNDENECTYQATRMCQDEVLLANSTEDEGGVIVADMTEDEGGVFVPDSTGDEDYEFGARRDATLNEVATEISARRLTAGRPSKANAHRLNDDDEMPVSERKRQPRVNRGLRKKRLLSTMGHDSTDLAGVDLDKIKRPTTNNARKRTRNRSKKDRATEKSLGDHASDNS